MNEDKLKTKLDEIGLGRISRQLLSLAKMSIRFTSVTSHDEEIQIGASKIGGDPDLPPATLFPEWNGEPLAFLAQINLADLTKFHAASELPSLGMLSFFYHVSQPWGYDPKHLGGWRVLFIDDLKELRRTMPPNSLPKEGHFHACTASFFEELTFPPYESLIMKELQLTNDETDYFFDFLDTSIAKTQYGMINRILGYPDPIQGDMQLECQMASNGVYYGDAKSHLHPRYNELKPGSVGWRLLMQLDSEEANARMMWGDGGRIYFWMHGTALKNMEFHKVWLSLQCA